MLSLRNCPRCGNDVTPEFSGVLMCGCGWVDGSNDKVAQAKLQTKTIYMMIASCALLLVGFMHAANWGSYALEVPFLRIEQFTGLLSAGGYGELAEACVYVNKWSCAENGYEQAYMKSGDPAQLLKLAHLQAKLGELASSSRTYERYFKAGGRDGEAMVAFAKILEVNRQDEKAMKLYDASIAARPDTLPVQAVGGIARILIKEGRYKEALIRLQAFQESAENAKGYLNKELEQVKAIVRTKADRMVASKRGGV